MKNVSWKRGSFNVSVNTRCMSPDDGTRKGYIRHPFAIASKSWVVTHLPTGLKACERASTLKEAKEIVDQLLPIVDWDSTEPLKNVSEDTRQKVRQVVLCA